MIREVDMFTEARGKHKKHWHTVNVRERLLEGLRHQLDTGGKPDLARALDLYHTSHIKATTQVLKEGKNQNSKPTRWSSVLIHLIIHCQQNVPSG